MKKISAFVLAALALSLAATAAEPITLPKAYASCTNLNKLTWPAMMAFRNDFTAAALKGDMVRFDAMMKLLEKTPVESPSFEMWMAGVNGLVRAGEEQQRKKPTERSKEVLAGFREGGSTFGLWQGSDAVESNPKAAFADAAINLLDKRMPKAGISPTLRVRLAQEKLRIKTRYGSYDTCLPLAGDVRQLAFSLQPVKQDETNALINAAMTYANFLADNAKYLPVAAFAREFRTKQAAALDASRAAYWLGYELGAYELANDEKSFKALKGDFAKLPLGPVARSGVEGFCKLATRPWPRHWAKIREIAQPLFDARKKVLSGRALCDLNHLRFEVAAGLNDYPTAKEAYAEIVALETALRKRWEAENAREKAARAAEALARKNRQKFTPYRRDFTIERPTDWIWRDSPTFATKAGEARDWKAAADALARALDRRNAMNHVRLVKALAQAGDVKRVHEVAAELHGTNVNAKADQIFAADAIVAWVDARDPASLRANLAKLRGDRDDKTWFNALRAAVRIYIGFDATPTREAWLKEVIAMSYELLWPEEKVEYVLTWMEDAPRTAEGAYLKNVFKTLKTENRMARYDAYSPFDKNKDLARVKSNPKPDLAAREPGKEAAVCAAYDESGLHVYARFNDPEAFKAREGVTGGFNCEYDFQPGGEAPWHWNMITRADEPGVDQGAVWDSPRKGFKVGGEYIREDTYVANDCYVLHLYIPWILCWNEFPKNGDVWRIVLVAGWSGQFGALGGSAVHELGRGMHMKFDLSAQARAKMLKALLREAVRDYHKVRDQWHNASFWADPDLGDPAFAEAVAEPFMKECDALAKECEAADLTDARAAEIYATRLGDLADFRLALDKKRSDWLKNAFFSARP